MYKTKTATQSVGVIAQVVAIIVMSLKLAGVDISAEVADLPNQAANAIDAVLILTAQLTALWGRLRADTKISGLFK
jgi:hypothetical protein